MDFNLKTKNLEIIHFISKSEKNLNLNEINEYWSIVTRLCDYIYHTMSICTVDKAMRCCTISNNICLPFSPCTYCFDFSSFFCLISFQQILVESSNICTRIRIQQIHINRNANKSLILIHGILWCMILFLIYHAQIFCIAV